ncbi:MAG: prolyl-tRNA synthetase [Pseudomonadota bacterium]|nr:prolyl-tRNA synthetase [Pseudomonadota bacterium]QKK06141.1 MAG: prolyl-tRNA synthetase [Pseudomonadota bacterium]
MRLSELATKTQKQISDSDVSRNAQFLTRAGYIGRLMAGVYSFLPLGMRVLSNIENIIRDEMNGIGGQEILMPALQPKDIWEKTGRWDKVDILFKLKGAGNRDLALGPTHEEVVTPLIAGFVQSYRDLPKAVYQIQTKFRNEARAKSGLLRGREFRMKDLYSFHAAQDDLDAFYEQATAAYHRIFARCGLGDITLLTYASGGIFSKYSHEFQTVTPYGEDVIYRVPGTNIAINKEIIEDRDVLTELIPGYKPGDEKNLEEVKAIEVGNIFKLGTRFAESFSAGFTDTDGTQKFPVMGCYGIGPSRVMGTIAECLSDENGLVWPEEIAPYQMHLVSLVNDAADIEKCEKIYRQLCAAGISVLYDDRDARAGEKLADADLIGLPHRVILGKKTLAEDCFEWKKRTETDSTVLPLKKICAIIPARSTA